MGPEGSTKWQLKVPKIIFFLSKDSFDNLIFFLLGEGSDRIKAKIVKLLMLHID